MAQTQIQTPQGAGVNAPISQTVQETVQISLDFGTYSNTFNYALLYSLRKRNFIKGNSHKGLSWSVDYRLFEGVYILLQTAGYLDERGAIIKASLVHISKRGGIKVLDTVKGMYIVPGKSDNPAVRAFFNALPGYHEKLVIPHLEGEGPSWKEIKAAVLSLNRKPTDPEA